MDERERNRFIPKIWCCAKFWASPFLRWRGIFLTFDTFVTNTVDTLSPSCVYLRHESQEYYLNPGCYKSHA